MYQSIDVCTMFKAIEMLLLLCESKRMIFFCSFLLFLLFFTPPPATSEKNAPVATLSLKNFHSTIAFSGLTAVLFCSDSVPRCVQFERDWQTASQLVLSRTSVQFARVPGKERGIQRLLGVTVPAVVIFRNGQLLERYIGSKVPLDVATYLDSLAANGVTARTPSAAAAAAADDNVLRLSDGAGLTDFDAMLATTTTVLVAFTTRDCSHCRRLAPQLTAAQASLTRDRSPGRVAQVDCDDLRVREQVCDQFDLKSFPALLLFRRGAFVHRFAGARTAEAIAEHVRQYASMRTEL